MTDACSCLLDKDNSRDMVMMLHSGDAVEAAEEENGELTVVVMNNPGGMHLPFRNSSLAFLCL